MTPLRNLKTVFIGKIFPVGLNGLSVLFIPYIANPLEKHQGQDITLPVRAVHGAAAQDVGCFPEVTFKGGEVDE
jgi:hypothetical protein